VLEETGIVARIERLIPGEFKGGTGMTIFYLMSVAEDTGELEDETSSVKWVTPAEARKLISMTTNPIGRNRDLAVLEALAL
jgi:8-oxo-dGTP diphosphatase